MDKQKEARGLGILMCWMVGWSILFPVFVGMIQGALQVSFPWYAIDLILEAGMVLCGFYYIDKRKDSITETIRLRPVRLFTLVKALLLIIVFQPVTLIVNLLSQLLVPNAAVEMTGNMLKESPFAVIFIVLALVAPLNEELFFRGILANRYKMITSLWKAVLMSALMFGLFHMNLNQFGYAFLLGILFAVVNELSGSCITSMLMHASINGFSALTLWMAEQASAMSGSNFAEEAEAARNAAEILVMLRGILIPAAIGLVLSYYLLKSIAKGEGREDIFRTLFSGTKAENLAESDEAEESVRLVNGYTILVIVILTIFMILDLILVRQL